MSSLNNHIMSQDDAKSPLPALLASNSLEDEHRKEEEPSHDTSHKVADDLSSKYEYPQNEDRLRGLEPTKDLERASKSDIEKQQPLQTPAPWNGPDDPENPRNWPIKKKWAAVAIVSAYTFISSISTSMVAPALSNISKDLHITDSEILSQMVLSIFVLAYAVGPLVLGPLSEIYGRVPVLQLSNLFFLIWNLVCGFARNAPEMMVFRFLAGLGGSAPLAIGSGVLADTFVAEQRGVAISLYTLGPLLGPAIGPIAGGFIAETIGWRWSFWIVTIVDGILQIAGLFLLQETYAPVLLSRRTKRVSQRTGDHITPKSEKDVAHETLAHKLRLGFIRPFRLLFTQPIIMCLAAYMAYLYGVNYIILSSFSSLYTTQYGESTGISGLHYIATALGLSIGAQGTARLTDKIYAKMKDRNGGVGRPEFRILTMIPCAIGVPIGLFWYGWSAKAHLFWIMPDIGVAIFAASTITGSRAIQSYLIDCYTRYAASATASINFLRCLCGFGFPLFSPYLYNAVGYGWGNSILAFIAIVLGIPAPWFFWHYGERLRQRSKYAAGE